LKRVKSKALKEGDVEIGIHSAEHVIHDVEEGGSLRMIAGNGNTLTHYLIAQPEIKTLQDLRGKVIGVSTLSAGTSSLFVDILERAGLNYPGDYTMIESGPVPPRHDQLINWEIDAGMQTDPHNYMAEDLGFSNLGLVSDWIPYFQFVSLNAKLEWAEKNRSQLVAFLSVCIRASRWVFENREESIDIASEKIGIERRYAERAWEDYGSMKAMPLDLHLNAKSIQTCMDMITRDRSGKHAIATTSTPSDYLDTTFLQEAQALAGVPEQLLV
jgi:NitT/TauT family transport system substrate-binding protein